MYLCDDCLLDLIDHTTSFIAELISSPFFSYRVYKASTTRRMVLFVLFLAMYAVVLPFCYLTAGEPRKAAMIAAQKLADEKWANEAFAVPNVTLSVNNGTLTGSSMGDDGNGTMVVESDVSVTGDTLSTTSTSSTSSAAALAVAAEAEKLKREKENKVKDSLDRLKVLGYNTYILSFFHTPTIIISSSQHTHSLTAYTIIS
jgi:hypothetical protein